MLSFKSIMARSCLMAALVATVRRSGGLRTASAFASSYITSTSRSASTTAFMTTTSTSTPSVIPRIKAADATTPTDGSPVVVKGWVRTVRKQKTLAFVEVNDGSNLAGLQCVLTFDDLDETSKQGREKPTILHS